MGQGRGGRGERDQELEVGLCPPCSWQNGEDSHALWIFGSR